MTYPSKCITMENLEIIDEMFSQYNRATIFGKGPTFQNIAVSDALHVGVNETANFLDKCDILVINDLENIDKIYDETWKKIKFLLIPEYIHYNYWVNKNITWRNVVDKIKDKYDGYYIIYNLKSNNIINKDLITLDSVISGSNTANDFVCQYLNKYVNHIDYYGIAILSQGSYNKNFTGLIKNNSYNVSSLLSIRNNLEQTCNRYKIKFTFN